MPLLAVRGSALATAEDAEAIPPLLVRAARFDQATLYFEELDALRGPEQQPIISPAGGIGRAMTPASSS